MKTKTISTILICMVLSSISCSRETDEILMENELNLQSNETKVQPISFGKTTNQSNNTTFWNTSYSNEPITINQLQADEDCPKSDVPRDGSHWIISNNDDCTSDVPRDGSHWIIKN